MNRSISLALVALTSIPLGVLWSNLHAAEAAVSASPPPPPTLVVSAASVSGEVRLGGTVEPQQLVSLTAQMPGEVKLVAGQEGDAFRQGDILVSLDTNSLLAKREQVLAQIASADAAYRNALVQYQRERISPNMQGNSMMGGAPGLFGMFADPARSMLGQGNPDLDRRSNLYAQGVQIETAINGLNQANAALRELDESLQNAHSIAPFDGVIVKKMVEQGDVVQPGMPLVSFADIEQLQIRVEVPTRLLGVVEAGGSFNARLDGTSEPIPVEVDRVFPMAGAGGHTTTVKFGLPGGTSARSGMYAEVSLPDPTGSQTALPVIPDSAVIWRGSLPSVYRVGPQGQVRMRLIRVGEHLPEGAYSVVSGLRSGDTILANAKDATRITQ